MISGKKKTPRGLENGADSKITQKGRLIQLQQLERYHPSITHKNFSKIIQERLTKALEQHISEEQVASGKENPAVTTYIL